MRDDEVVVLGHGTEEISTEGCVMLQVVQQEVQNIPSFPVRVCCS